MKGFVLMSQVSQLLKEGVHCHQKVEGAAMDAQKWCKAISINFPASEMFPAPSSDLTVALLSNLLSECKLGATYDFP